MFDPVHVIHTQGGSYAFSSFWEDIWSTILGARHCGETSFRGPVTTLSWLFWKGRSKSITFQSLTIHNLQVKCQKSPSFYVKCLIYVPVGLSYDNQMLVTWYVALPIICCLIWMRCIKPFNCSRRKWHKWGLLVQCQHSRSKDLLSLTRLAIRLFIQ